MEISTKNQEEISLCYFNAVVAKANAVPNLCKRDEDGIDATIRKDLDVSGGDVFSAEINFQLKSVYSKSSYGFTSDGKIYYDLKVKNYNDLVKKSAIKRYLVLLILPENKDEWVEQNEEQLLIRKCMYYASFKGCMPSSNSDTVRVMIDKNNVFNSESLINILEKTIHEDTKNVNE